MATTSTFVTVKAALIDALAARPALSAVEVNYQWKPRVEGDQVYLGSNTDITSRIPTIMAGRQSRDETIRFDVVCVAIDNDGTPDTLKATELRAASYLAELEDQLADDFQVDGLDQIQWALMDEVAVRSGPLGKGWTTLITATVQAKARLR